MANARAYSVIDVILGEAGGRSRSDRYQDMLNIASAIANRAAATGETPEAIVSVQSQFNAYDKTLPAGVGAFRSLAERAWNTVLQSGPVHNGTYFATSAALGNLPRGLTRVSDGVNGGHVIFADPKNRPIITASGVRPINPDALAAAGQQETATAEADPFSILSPDLARPGSTRIAESAAYFPEAPAPTPAPPPSPELGAMRAPSVSPETTNSIAERLVTGFQRGGPLGVIPTPGTAGLGSMIPPAPMQRVDTRGSGLELGRIPMVSPVYQPQPEMGAMRPSAPPAPPSEGRFARDFGPTGPMGIAPTPGLMGFGSSEPPAEMARAGVRDGGPFANIPMVPPNFQPQPEMAAMRPGIPQTNPLDAIRVAAPERSIPDVARVMAGEPISPGSMFGQQDVDRAKADRPTDGVPYSGPGSYFTPEAVEQSRLSNTPPSFFEGGMHRAGLMGMPAGPDPRTPLMAGGQMRAPDLKSEPFGQVAPKSVTTSREVRAALPTVPGFAMPARGGLGPFATAYAPEVPETAAATPRGSSRRDPVRISQISLGQPGGKYAGSGMSAMNSVNSGKAAPGTVAFSRSQPGFTAMALPAGLVAHTNQYGVTSIRSPADDDEIGVHRGMVAAVDPTGKSYKTVTPDEAKALQALGWSISTSKSNPATVAKSSGNTARSGPQRSGLLGFLSSLSNQSRGPAASGPQQGPGGLLGSLFGGMFGNVGVGLGGGIGGGGGGLGGYGNPGFGGGMQNDNYSGL